MESTVKFGMAVTYLSHERNRGSFLPERAATQAVETARASGIPAQIVDTYTALLGNTVGEYNATLSGVVGAIDSLDRTNKDHLKTLGAQTVNNAFKEYALPIQLPPI